MKPIKKLAAGLLISVGFFFLMISIAELVDKDTTRTEKQEASDTAIGGIIIGVPFVVAGGWLIRGLRQQQQKQIGDRIHNTFYRLVTENNGKITVFRFANETQLTATAAKLYLDNKAAEFNASFEIDVNGNIYYQFYL